MDCKETAQETVLAVYRTATDREITFLAAGFAYYAFVSVIPLVTLAIVVGSLLGGEQEAQQLVSMAGEFLPEAGADLVVDVLTTEAGRAEATVVALLVATWGALKVFRGLSSAFDTIYDDVAEDTLVDEIRDGLVVIAAGVGALGLMVVVGTVLGTLAGTIPYVGTVSWIALPLGLFLVFLPMYSVLPPISVPLREALPGAAFAAFGWTVLQAGFQLYAASAGQYEAYGVLGAILLFVTWLYLAGIIVLLGATINVVRARPALAT